MSDDPRRAPPQADEDTVPDVPPPDDGRVTAPITVVAKTVTTRARELAPGTTLGRYRVIGPLGEGGMAVVYAAQDDELNRRVALKLLRPRLRSSAADARLLREAQAMARLSHPNVVTVFDVGTTGERIWLALELIDGSTLRDWLAAGARPWREVLEVLLAAGRGLAAAHAAGIIHRDFTPNNILVGSDGRVRVTDFGLARAVDAPSEEESGERSGEREPVSPDASTELAWSDSGSSPLEAPLTEAGVLMGTPGYIAPEMYLGKPVDARTDQFTYCVTLYRALYGVQPFESASLEQARGAALTGTIPDPPDGTKVPARILRIIKRGLSPAPEQRFASMTELLAELARDPGARRRRWAVRAGLGAAVAALVSGAFLLESQREESCRDAAHHLTGIWNPAIAGRAHAAFAATRLPYAEKTWQATDRLLDRWADDWVDMRTDACMDTRIRREHTEEVMTRRMVCLERNAEDARALTRLLAEADAEMVKRAVGAVTALGSLRECADVEALMADVRPPPDAATAARVSEVRARLAGIRALDRAGRPGEAVTGARAEVEKARALGYAPLLAEALYEQGRLEYSTATAAAAVEPLRRSLLIAESARADDLVGRAASELLMVHARGLADDARGREWAEFAAAVVERQGSRPIDRIRLERGLAQLHAHAGRYDEAIEHQTLVLDLVERLEATADHPEVGGALLDLGNMYQFARQNDAALAAYERALAIFERQVGREHPQTVATIGNIANMLNLQGRHQEAVARTREVIDILVRTYGEVHGQVAIAHLNLGSQLGDSGEHAAAVEEMRRALEIGRAVYPPEHPMMVAAHIGLAGSLREAGDLRGSLAAGERGLAVSEKAYGKGHPQTGFAFTEIGRTHLAMGKPRDALPNLERAVALLVERKVSPLDLASSRFALAQALWKSGGDRRRAVELAGAARQAWIEAGAAAEETAAEAQAWLAAHRVE